MTSMTKRDAIESAMGLATDVAEGRLDPADLEAQAVAELQQLVGTVVGPGDLAWDLQVQIARGVLAAGGIPADELSEWLAVERHRAGEPVSQPELPDDQPEPPSLLSGQLSTANGHADADPEPQPDIEVNALADPPEPEAEQPADPTPRRRADGYDPLAGWSPGRSRRPL